MLAFTAGLEENLITIQNQLTQKTYTPGEYRKFFVYEPKQRQIMALPFPDRVVQHALNNIIEPLFDKAWIYHSYACRKNKGMHKASETLSHWLYDFNLRYGSDVYCLKADISKYFWTIDHDVLKTLIRRKIKCPDTLWLIDLIINHNGGAGVNMGIPVGNLTSQLFANEYLNVLDRYVKEGLRLHYYMRYMDDFIILSEDKRCLKDALADIERFLADKLRLKLNPKTGIFKVTQGVNYVGYRHWHTHKLIRKSSIKRVTRKIRKFNAAYTRGEANVEKFNKSLQSWLGHIGHADTYRIRGRIISGIALSQSPE